MKIKQKNIMQEVEKENNATIQIKGKKLKQI